MEIRKGNRIQKVKVYAMLAPAEMTMPVIPARRRPTLAFFTSIPGRELGLGAAVALSFFPLLASLIVIGGRVLLRGAEE